MRRIGLFEISVLIPLDIQSALSLSHNRRGPLRVRRVGRRHGLHHARPGVLRRRAAAARAQLLQLRRLPPRAHARLQHGLLRRRRRPLPHRPQLRVGIHALRV